ncbi:MAG: ABC transporter permease [Pararhodobacter sp.]
METNVPARGKAHNPAMRSPAVTLVLTARTIMALILREMSTRFGRTPGGFVWAVLQPLGLIIMMGMAFSLLARSPALGTSFILFKATGLLPFTMFKGTATQVGKSLNFSRQLLMYPGVTWIDALLARLILNIMVSVLVAVLILTGIILYEGVTLILDWNKIFLSAALAFILAFGIGALNCYLFERFDVWSNIWNILTAPLMIISGVIFLYESLPPVAQNVLWYNPLMHIVGLMREGFYSTYKPAYISITYVMVCALIPMVLGLLLVRKHHLYLLNR